MSHKTGQSDETCHFGGGAALFSIALVAASQRSTNGPQLARRSLPELEAAACGGKGLFNLIHVNCNNHVLSLRSRGFCGYVNTVEKVHVKSFKSHSHSEWLRQGEKRSQRRRKEKGKKGGVYQQNLPSHPSGPKIREREGVRTECLVWSSYGSQATAQSQGRAAANAGLRRPLGVDPPFKPLGVEADAPMRLCV
ncbi:unnamed protein product [Fusarium graminearum]|nr:unnamed protein product [Fusarium graminearum]